MSQKKAPKQWCLTKEENLNSFNAWKENLIYVLSLDSNFTPYLKAGVTWEKQTPTDEYRGFIDDGEEVTDAAARKTKETKVTHLNMLLGQIANFASIISRNQLIKNSTSLNDVWGKIREHYGFHSTGAKFLDFGNVRLKTGERAEDLYQRLVTFIDDNMLTTADKIKHHGTTVTTDEELTPTLENVIVFTWLERIHVGLPGLIKQKYGSELRNQTLSSLKSEISQSLDSLLDELKTVDESRVQRTSTYPYPNRNRQSTFQSTRTGSKFCCLCHAAKRPSDSHYLSQCKYLPEGDRKRLSKVRTVDIESEEDVDVDTEDNSNFIDNPVTSVHRRVTTRRSPYLSCFHGHYPVTMCLDTGAESSLVSERFAKFAGLVIQHATQSAVQADVSTPLNIVGEVKDVSITRGPHLFLLDALVTKTDFGDVIAGEPFLEKNDIAIRPSKKQIIIKGKDIIPYNQCL